MVYDDHRPQIMIGKWKFGMGAGHSHLRPISPLLSFVDTLSYL